MAKKNEKGSKINIVNTTNNLKADISFTKKIENTFKDLVNITKNIEQKLEINNFYEYSPIFNIINEASFVDMRTLDSVVEIPATGKKPEGQKDDDESDVKSAKLNFEGPALFSKMQAFMEIPIVAKGVEFLDEKLKAVVASAENMNKAESAISSIIPDKNTASAFFDHVQKKSMDSINGVEKVAGAYQQFLGVTKNTASLDNLVGFSEKLALFDTSGEGLDGAVKAVEKLAGGDYTAISEYLNIPENQLQGLNLAEIIEPGDIDGNLSRLQQRLSETGVLTDQMIQDRMSSSDVAVGGTLSKIQTKLAIAMGTILDKMSPLVDKAYEFINVLLNSEIVNIVIDVIAVSFYIVGFILEKIIGFVVEVANFIIDNWSMIEPIVTGIGLAILGVVIVLGIIFGAMMLYQGAVWLVTTATAIWSIIQGVANAALFTCPLVWIIGLIIGIILALIYWSDGMGVVVGAVFALGAIFANIFSFIWNTILMVAEGLNNAFLWAIESVINLFVWLHNLFLDYIVKPILWGAATIGDALANAFISGVNQAIGGINWLIEAINHIPGISIEKLGTWDAKSNLADGVDDFVDSKKMAQVTIPRTNLDHLKTGYSDVGDAYNSGFDIGKGGAEAIKSGIRGLLDTSTKNAGAVPENLGGDILPNIDSIPGMNESPAAIENIDKGITDLPEAMPGSQNNPSTVEGEVNISEESLQLMRDVANMRYVQNFISVTPNVAVNGVTVNENADYNMLVDKIAKGLDEGLQTEASGVYV